MKGIILMFAVVLGVTKFSGAQPSGFKISEIFPIEAAHSYVGFSIKYMGYAMVRGRFSDFQGSIRYNELDFTKTSCTMLINVSSIETGNEWRDEDLKSENWFGSQAYPQILFKSTKADVTPQGLRITGDLTIRGITKTVSIPLTFPPHVLKDVREDSQIVFTGSMTLNRIDFGVVGKTWAGVKEGITAVSDEVHVELTILGKRINTPNFQYWVADLTSPHGKIYYTARNNGVEKALVEFESLRSAIGSKVNVETLNTAGMMLLKEGNAEDAMVLFKKNIAVFPHLSLVYESYAEAAATLGNWPEALKYYSLALEKDPGNANAIEILKHIKT